MEAAFAQAHGTAFEKQSRRRGFVDGESNQIASNGHAYCTCYIEL
jgi:hypothetical protein